jgi:2-polyprenyl-3-methyl-5-hydroxy-6-metoxy-1,4-benzoquinol methylase
MFSKLSFKIRFLAFLSHVLRIFSRLNLKNFCNYSLDKKAISECNLCQNKTKQFYISRVFFNYHFRVYKKDTENKKYYFYYCRKCHYAYFQAPPQKYLDFFYKKELYRNAKLSDKVELKHLNSNIMTADIRYINSLIEAAGIKLNKKMTILEIGSGRSAFVNFYSKKQLKITLNDLSKTSLNFMSRNFDVNVICSDILQIPLKFNSTFDFIYSKDTLEHLPKIRESLFRISSLLRNKGVCVFSVPNLDSKTMGLILDPHIAFSFPDHLNYFSILSFQRNCRTFGLDVLYSTTHSSQEEMVYAADLVSDLGLLRLKYDLKTIVNTEKNERIFIALRKI